MSLFRDLRVSALSLELDARRWFCLADLSLLLLLILSSFVVAPGQTNEKEPPQGEKLEAVVTGVRANVVDGKVTVQREGSSFELTPDTELKDGDVLISDADGRAEFLLQPGNYLRMTADTKLQFVSTQYDKLRVHVETGGLAWELLKQEKPRFFEPFSFFMIRITTNRSEAMLTEYGIYRFNVIKDAAELLVRKGEAELNSQHVKEKRVARELAGVTAIGEFDPKIEDAFDTWCRERANKLTQDNRQLKKDAPWAKHNKDTEAIVDIPSEDSPVDSPYVVSAKPGKVTYVDGGVEFSRGEEWETVTLDSSLRSQDKLRSAAYSRVELMMFPDIFLRIDGNSEVVFEELTNDAVFIRLVKGSAILEAGDFDRKRLPEFKIGGASTYAVVLSNGNYRWDVTTNGAQISARDGKLSISGRSMNGCRNFAGTGPVECEKRRRDNFDFWSEFRGEGVTGNGRALANRWARVRQRWLRNTGFWYRSPSVGYYTFVPYSSSDFNSPYGGSYSVVLSPRRTPAPRPERGRPFPLAERTTPDLQ